MFDKLRGTSRTEEGASAVEYGLLVALIAAIIVVAVFAIGSLVRNTFQDTCQSIEDNASSTSDAGCS